MNLYIHDILNFFRHDPRVKFVDLSKDLHIQRKVLYDYCDEKTKPDFLREKGMIYFFKELYEEKSNPEEKPLEIESYYKDKEKTILTKDLVRKVIKDGVDEKKLVKLPDEISSGTQLLIFSCIGVERASAKHAAIHKQTVGDYQLTIYKDENDKNKYVIEIANVKGNNIENKHILIINGFNKLKLTKSEGNKAWEFIDKSKIDHTEKFYVNIR